MELRFSRRCFHLVIFPVVLMDFQKKGSCLFMSPVHSVCKEEGWPLLLCEAAQLMGRAGMVSCSSAVGIGGGGGED